MVNLGHFLLFYPLKTLKIKIFKNEKICWRYHHFTHLYQKSTIIWYMVTETLSVIDRIFCHHGTFFALLPPMEPENQNFEKMKKALEDIIILQMFTINDSHMIYGFSDMECNRQTFLSFLSFSKFWKNGKKNPADIIILHKWKKIQQISSFYTSVPKIMIKCYSSPQVWHVTDVIIFYFWPFFVLLYVKTLRNKNLKKMKKKTPRDIIIYKVMIRWCTVLEIWCVTDVIVISQFGLFFVFLPSHPFKTQKIEILTKMKKKKIPGDTIILQQMCTKSFDQKMCSSWDMCDRCNCYFSFWAIFCPFAPLKAQKIEVLKKWKNHPRLSSIYIRVPKIMITRCTVPEIWCVTDVIVIFEFGQGFVLLLP